MIQISNASIDITFSSFHFLFFLYTYPKFTSLWLKFLWCATSQHRYQLQTSALSTVPWLTSEVSTQSLHLYRRLPGTEDPRAMNGVVVFRCTSSTVTDSPLVTASHSPDTAGDHSSISAGLREWRADMPACLSSTPTPVSTECVSAADLSCALLRPPHRLARHFALAEHSRANLVEDSCVDVLDAAWDCTALLVSACSCGWLTWSMWPQFN